MTTFPSELILGRTYFSLAYEDEKLTRLYIHSLRYLGVNSESPANEPHHIFQFIGSSNGSEPPPLEESSSAEAGDKLVIGDGQLDMILSFEDLASELLRLAPSNGAWVPHEE